MAAGSSAPEVFISLVGVFVSETSMGIGAIVGSAVFNILFVIGICGLFIAGVRFHVPALLKTTLRESLTDLLALF